MKNSLFFRSLGNRLNFCEEIAEDGTCLGEIDTDLNRSIFSLQCKPAYKKDKKGKCRKVIKP